MVFSIRLVNVNVFYQVRYQVEFNSLLIFVSQNIPCVIASRSAPERGGPGGGARGVHGGGARLGGRLRRAAALPAAAAPRAALHLQVHRHRVQYVPHTYMFLYYTIFIPKETNVCIDLTRISVLSQ